MSLSEFFMNLFQALLLISLLLLVIGIFKPNISLFWTKKKNKKKSLIVYLGLSILFFVLFGITIPSESATKTTSTPNKAVINKHPIKHDEPVSHKTNVQKPTIKNESKPETVKSTTTKPNLSHISGSFGLGDSKYWIESDLGKPSTIQNKEAGQFAYDNNNIQVTYTNGFVSYYEKEFDVNKEISFSEGKIIAREMIPTDSFFIKKYTNNDGGATEEIYVYKSKKLSALWPSSLQMFVNANGVNQPGVFDVVYTFDSLNNPTKLMSVGVFASDNP